MSHATVLDRNGLPRMETLVRRILRIFDSASPRDMEEGIRWYDDAYVLASDLAPALSRDGDGLRLAAEVISALSPRTQWSRNAAGAALLILHDEALPGLLGRNVSMARRIISGEKNVLKGKKTRSFARNIAGDREAVTLDVWAMRAVDIPDSLLSRKGVYEAISHAYRLAAAKRGMDPATMQAVVWVTFRREVMIDRMNDRMKK